MIASSHPTRPTQGNPRSDSELLALAASGSTRSFQTLFERHSAAIQRYAAARLGPTSADDVTVETFTVAWTRASAFDAQRGSVRAWLFGIASMLIRNHVQQEIRWQRSAERMAASVSVESLEEADHAVDSTADVLRALATLPVKEREIALLVSIGDLSISEAASTLGISGVAARMRLARARKSFRLLVSERSEND